MPFYERDGNQFVATPFTRGPWDARHQHGGPPAALLAGAMARFEGNDAFMLARFSAQFMGAVPITTLDVQVELIHAGRTAQHLAATLSANGRPYMRATALRLRCVETPRAHEENAKSPTWVAPESLTSWEFPFFRDAMGYHKAVEIKIVKGTWPDTPIHVWCRPTEALVDGRPTLPIERLITVADAQSGLGPPLDPFRWTFPNPELTVTLARQPRGSWFGFDIRSLAGPTGIGLSQSLLRDQDGEFGGSVQSLIVRTAISY